MTIKEKYLANCKTYMQGVNLPAWAIVRCLADCDVLIEAIVISGDKGVARAKLDSYLDGARKIKWQKLPPDTVRIEGESVDSWVDRMYAGW